uniref:Transcription regulator n=1 Tax=Colletotrichum fructicola (strain Nara gc5) TaxID=1213859 RepID=L2FJI1_COLFN
MTFTEDLIASDPEGYRLATQSPFLTAAAAGTCPKSHLSYWLSNDRLYIHSYIRGAGRLLSTVHLPDLVPDDLTTPQKLIIWLTDALCNINRELRFFYTTAAEYILTLDLPAKDGVVEPTAKLEGLHRFGSPRASRPARGSCRGSRARMRWTCKDGSDDSDGGALRNAFIPNWTNDDFWQFVNAMRVTIEHGVAEAVEAGKASEEELKKRALAVWNQVLLAEKEFWPDMTKEHFEETES